MGMNIPVLAWPDTQQTFKFWCQRVLPAVYDSSLSYYELLCKVVDYLNTTMENVNALNENGQAMQKEIEELQKLFEEFKTSGFDDYYAARMEQWIRSNAERIIKSMMLIGVTFGLTSDGYFCAYIPETWSDIVFDMGAVYGRSDYGCLILQYEVDDGIDNTYVYKAPQPSEQNVVGKMAKDMELTIAILDTPLDELVIGGSL